MKKILLSIAAMAALAACNSEKNTEPTYDLTPTQNLTVRIAGVDGASTRMIGAPATTGQLKMNNGHIFVINALGAVEHDTPADMATITTTGQTIQTKVSSDSRVYVLGNISPNVDMSSLTTWDKIKAATLSFNAGEEKDYTKSIIGNVGTPTDGGIPVAIDKSDGNGNAKVHIDLLPLYSRIELDKVTGGDSIVTFEVEGVYPDKYFSAFTLHGLASGNLWSQGVSTDFSSNEGVSAPNLGVADEKSGPWASTGTPAVAAPAAPNVWNYHVASADLPRFIVKLGKIQYKDANGATQTYMGNGDGIAYLTIAKYNENVTAFERGKYYQVSGLKFNPSNLGLTPNPSNVTLTADVKVIDWSAVTLTPVAQ